MSKQRRTVLSGIVSPVVREIAPPPGATTSADVVEMKTAARRRSATKDTTVQQTVYLPPAVHEQLRELAFSERVKMHSLIMEGLDAVFRTRGMKSIAVLTEKP